MDQNEWNGQPHITYWITRMVKGGNRTSPTLYLNKEWGFEKGEIVDIVIYRTEELHPEPIYATCRVSAVNNSTLIYMLKDWNIRAGEMLTVKLRRRPLVSDS